MSERHIVSENPNRAIRSVITTDKSKVTFDVMGKKGNVSTFSDLTTEEARAWAEFILGNTPEPEPPTASEFLNSLEPGTMFRNPRTGSEFVMLREGRYIRTKVGDNAKYATQAGQSYAYDTHYNTSIPNPFEVM